MITLINGDLNLLCFYGTKKTKKLCQGREKIGVISTISQQWQLEWDYTGEVFVMFLRFLIFVWKIFSDMFLLFAAVSIRRLLSLAKLLCQIIDLILMINAHKERYILIDAFVLCMLLCLAFVYQDRELIDRYLVM